MNLPKLNKQDFLSDGSFYYSKRKELVKAYLFDGLSYKELDTYILNIDGNLSKGWVSHAFLNRYLGLTRDYKNIFENITIEDAIFELKSKSDDSFNELISILEDIISNNQQNTLIGENNLYYGVPGCGKSNYVKNTILKDVEEFNIERVLFHPDYTYGDFVGQILPKVTDGNVSYEFTAGPFTRIMKKAYDNVFETYYLIIEEINRGNAPAIFGDIFQLLDRKTEENDDDLPIGTSEYFITNSYIANKIYNDEQKKAFGDKVRIPSNLFIIATMNTSDQNVFTLDTAFQRRWNMNMIENSFDNVDKEFSNTPVLGTDVSWEKFCTTINDLILAENKRIMSSEDKRLGVYFVNKKELDEENSDLFAQKVIKYLWDDAFKFSRENIFDEKYTSLEYIIRDLKDDEIEKFSIFKETIQNKLNNKEKITPKNQTPTSSDENMEENSDLEQAENNDSE